MHSLKSNKMKGRKECMERVAIIDTTSRCNLKCSHCYNQERYWENAAQYRDLSTDEITSMICKLKEMNFTRLHLLGGEPLLAPHLLDFITCGRNNNLDVSIVTNGTLLNEVIMGKICELGVFSISVSMDGTTAKSNDSIRGHGVFDKVTNNIRECVAIKRKLNSDIKIGTSFTLTKQNLKTSNDLMDFANELGLDFVNLSYLSNEGKARDTYNDNYVSEEEKFQFIDDIINSYKIHNSNLALNVDARSCLAEYIYKKHNVVLEAAYFVGCGGSDAQFYVLADGTLLPCSPSGTSMGCQLNSEYLKEETPPNLLTDNVEQIINSPYLIKFYNFTHDAETYKNIKPCRNCKYECKPCPLLYKNDNTTVSECVYAMQKIKEMDRNFMDLPIKINPHLRIATVNNKTVLLSFLTQEEYILEDTALYIWNHIDGKITGNEIVRLILKDFNFQEDIFEQIEEDVIEYLYQLKNENFIIV